MKKERENEREKAYLILLSLESIEMDSEQKMVESRVEKVPDE